MENETDLNTECRDPSC